MCLDALPSLYTAQKGLDKVTMNARPWSDLQSTPPNPMVCQYGGGTKEYC